jgi:PAS domain S-box-containing protein
MSQTIEPDIGDPEIAQLVLNNAREYAIMTLDHDGHITSWSAGAEAVFGYAPSEIIGCLSGQLFVPSDLAAQADRLELDVAREHGRAENSRWHQRKDGERFWGNGVLVALTEGGHDGFLKIMRDETRTKLADEQRILLLNELNHRIKNTLATVQSIAEQTLRAGKVDAATRANLTSRLIALSEAHNVLVAENWAGADLEGIVSKALAAHRGSAPARFRVEGPPVRLSPQQAVSLSLALHELATNALKYGSLSVETGRVEVTWNFAIDGDGRRYMNLLWLESGGPPVRPPQRTGFGTRLIARTFSANDGRATMDYRPEGLRCVIELPLSSPEEVPILDVAAVKRGGHAL